MAQITTALPVEFSGNNDNCQHTRERDILEMNIQAPKINYLTKGVLDSCTCNYTDIMTRKDANCFHYDFNKFYSAGSTFFLRIPIINSVEKSIGKTFTFTYRIKNCTENPTTNTIVIYVIYTDNSTTCLKNNHVPQDGLYSITVESVKNVSRIEFLHVANRPAYNFQFDLEIISFIEGDTPLERNTSFSDEIKVVTSNNELVLGEYEVSRKIRRHIMQAERNIFAMQDMFKINWR